MKTNNDLLTSIQEYVETGRGKKLCFDRIYHCLDCSNLKRYLIEVEKLGFNKNNPRLEEVIDEMKFRAFQY